MEMKESIDERLLVYARKVVAHQIGSPGYDPADMLNLEMCLMQWDRQQALTQTGYIQTRLLLQQWSSEERSRQIKNNIHEKI